MHKLGINDCGLSQFWFVLMGHGLSNFTVRLQLLFGSLSLEQSPSELYAQVAQSITLLLFSLGAGKVASTVLRVPTQNLKCIKVGGNSKG